MTRLPTLVDYSDAVSNPRVAFLDSRLALATFKSSMFGPTPSTGGFAITFEATTTTGKKAVRCFHRSTEQLSARYDAISRFVASHPASFLARVDYAALGIRVQGRTFPVVTMDWIQGKRLDAWLEDGGVNRRSDLRRVRENIANAVADLQGWGAAHGDLQHGNIMVRPDLTVAFIDYDGMYLPELATLGPGEAGLPAYQHPGRGSQFDESLDVFSAAVIDLSLRALELQPDLYARYSMGENLLFTRDDFTAPSSAAVFGAIGGLPGLKPMADRLRSACMAEYRAAVQILSGGKVGAHSPNAFAPAGAAAHRTGPVSAVDRKGLKERIGDEATVVGRIRTAYVGTDRNGRDYAFLNFGSRAFTIVCWPNVFAQLTRDTDVSELQGQWIRITGTLNEYEGKPQIELRRPSQLHRLDEARARGLLHAEDLASDGRSNGTATTAPTSRGPAPTNSTAQGRRTSGPAGASSFAEDLDALVRAEQKRNAASQRQPPSAAPTTSPQPSRPPAGEVAKPGPRPAAPVQPRQHPSRTPKRQTLWQRIRDWFD